MERMYRSLMTTAAAHAFNYAMAEALAPTLKDQFAAFSKFGDSKSDGTTITLTQLDKWMKQANVIDGKWLTMTDTGITFNKFKLRTINFSTFERFIEDLASSKKMQAESLREKLINCGAPGTIGTTKISKTGAVERMTDTSLYTGSHKERFDESGKGKGIKGREDIADTSGYVTGYKEKDTYDNKQGN